MTDRERIRVLENRVAALERENAELRAAAAVKENEALRQRLAELEATVAAAATPSNPEPLT